MARLVMMYGICVLIPVSHCLFIFTATYQAPCPLQPEFINVHMLTVNEISMSATFVLLMKPDWPTYGVMDIQTLSSYSV